MIYAPNEVHLTFGQPAILDCNFRSNPPLTNLRWEKDNLLFDPYNVQVSFRCLNISVRSSVITDFILSSGRVLQAQRQPFLQPCPGLAHGTLHLHALQRAGHFGALHSNQRYRTAAALNHGEAQADVHHQIGR